MRKFGIFLALTLVLITLTAGCAKDTIVTNDFIDGQSGGDAETLNWILAADASSFGYAGHTVDSLATYDNQWNLQLRCLAKDIEVSPDGLVYTVTIRDDLKWSNGSPVTAEDYVYTLKNLMFSDWLNYPYKGDWQEVVDGKTVLVTPQAVNDTTFTITRQTVYPEFIYTIYNLTPYPKYIAVNYEGNVEAFTQAPEFNNLTYTGNLGPGSVYPLLSLLQDEGLIRPHEDGDPSLKRFTLTDAGLQEINELTEHSQHMRNRNKSIRKIYWRLYMEMPEGLYESLSGFMDAFEAAYTMYKGDPEKAVKLKGILDRATGELKEKGV